MGIYELGSVGQLLKSGTISGRLYYEKRVN